LILFIGMLVVNFGQQFQGYDSTHKGGESN
jgi:hypothetical protein